MTERLYYKDGFVSEFDATVVETRSLDGRQAVLLDRTAFYPTSGGQLSDTGVLMTAGAKLTVTEIAEDSGGEVLHFMEGEAPGAGTPVHGSVEMERRRDHMQQHSGQHVLSAAFVRLFGLPTLSFHMGEHVGPDGEPKTCTIDLEAKSIDEAQLREAERLANAIVTEDRPVEIRFARPDEARAMGVRKLPPELRDEVRLIDIQDFDLNACGGTHVRRTGQIGPILLRKIEKVKQGIRVEFVCGQRAISIARRDFEALAQAAAVYSAHMWSLPEQIRKSLDEVKAAQKESKKLQEEVAELYAERMLRENAGGTGARIITRVFSDRDLGFIKILAHKLTAAGDQANGTIVALLGSGGPQPALVFAKSAGGPFDMGALLKETMAALGGRGGGNREMAQGGAPAGADLERAIAAARQRLEH